MKINVLLPAFSFFSLAFQHKTNALLDCDAAYTRSAAKPAVCAHFQGIDPDGYREWYDLNNISIKYPSMVYIPGSDPSQPQNGAAIHWNVQDEYVHIAVAARATGWLGFGIAEAGGMLGTDMALFTASRPDEIVDAYTTDLRFPQQDDCSHDWELIASNVDTDNGFIMFEAKRLLNTGDPQDKVIVNDSSSLIPPYRVIAAWGDTPEVGYHGLNRARGAIRFFGLADEKTTFERTMKQQAEGSFLIRSKDHEIASNSTTEYAYTCFSREDLINQGLNDTQDMLNIIGFEPELSSGTEAYVHHFIVKGSQNASCSGDYFTELVYVWAPGEGGLALPENLGSPLFGEDGFQAFEIEVHYNNPNMDEGVIDSSGVRLYWTSQPREEQIGILSVGDPFVSLYGEPVGNGSMLHQFECPGSCSSSFINSKVTVLREYLHMHQTGARMTNEQIRNGQVIRTGVVDYWEFDQNGNIAAEEASFDLLPGDEFRTSCYYEGEGRSFGLGSSEEMCMAFLYYYPRAPKLEVAPGMELSWFCGYDLPVPTCNATHVETKLSGPEDYGRIFGTPPSDLSSCNVAIGSTIYGQQDASKDDVSSGTGAQFRTALFLAFGICFFFFV